MITQKMAPTKMLKMIFLLWSRLRSKTKLELMSVTKHLLLSLCNSVKSFMKLSRKLMAKRLSSRSKILLKR